MKDLFAMPPSVFDLLRLRSPELTTAPTADILFRGTCPRCRGRTLAASSNVPDLVWCYGSFLQVKQASQSCGWHGSLELIQRAPQGEAP